MTALTLPVRIRRFEARWVIAALGANLAVGLLVVRLARWGPDWPAQEFRAGLARQFGLVAWDNLWYSGHALPGYSALYPVLASVLGASLTGAAALVGAAWATQRLLPADTTTAARVAVTVAAAGGLGSSLLIGQLPFLLGVAFGLTAVVALLHERPRAALVLAVLCSLASPFAGVHLLLSAFALAAVVGRRRACVLGGALAGPVVAVVVGGAGGTFPCQWTDLVGGLAFCAAGWLASRPGDVVLRRLCGSYAVAVAFAFFVPNPVGGNITRLGKLVAVPLAVWLLTRDGHVDRRLASGLLAGAVLWAGIPLAADIATGAPDPSRQAVFYRGLLTYLRTQDPIAGRLEVPMTRQHWESAFVAPAFPLARGWERQTDLAQNATLYRSLTASAYKRWLDNAGVALIALANAPIDAGGRAEQRLLATPPAYLQLVYADPHWRVWRVLGALPLATGAATMTKLGPASFEARFSRAGSALVRIRASGLWQVSAGAACLSTDPNGWLRVTAAAPGLVTVRARLNVRMLTGPADCDLGRR